jgi:tRNA(Ser,Leu) C12 N-acetylase TAN1
MTNYNDMISIWRKVMADLKNVTFYNAVVQMEIELTKAIDHLLNAIQALCLHL